MSWGLSPKNCGVLHVTYRKSQWNWRSGWPENLRFRKSRRHFQGNQQLLWGLTQNPGLMTLTPGFTQQGHAATPFALAFAGPEFGLSYLLNIPKGMGTLSLHIAAGASDTASAI